MYIHRTNDRRETDLAMGVEPSVESAESSRGFRVEAVRRRRGSSGAEALKCEGGGTRIDVWSAVGRGDGAHGLTRRSWCDCRAHGLSRRMWHVCHRGSAGVRGTSFGTRWGCSSLTRRGKRYRRRHLHLHVTGYREGRSSLALRTRDFRVSGALRRARYI